MKKIFISCFMLALAICINAQQTQSAVQTQAQEKAKTYLQVNDPSWRILVYDSPDEWFGSEEAIVIAENVLLYQFEIGGWPKNTQMQKTLTEEEKQEIIAQKPTNVGATTDNGATVMEMDFLSKVYRHTHEERYREAFVRGLNYLIEAQYASGGFPQFYPLRKGYYSNITYNDDSMYRIMTLLKNIAKEDNHFDIIVDEVTAKKAQIAFDLGVECILKTQYLQNGVLTGWCAQYDEKTLLPTKARAYELPSLSGQEGANLVLLLMDIENPSPEIINAVRSAVDWFDKVRIKGIRVEIFRDENGKRDRRVVEDSTAPDIWARFYTLENNTPFFCDRDGVMRYSLAEIGQERRGGYGWYSLAPHKIFEKYPEWEKRISKFL